MATQSPMFCNLKEYLFPFALSHLLVGALVVLIIINKLALHSKSKPHSQDDHHRRPCPSSVPIPAHHYFIAEPLKEMLIPAMTYRSFLEKIGKSSPRSSDRVEDDGDHHESTCVCIVCMDCMAASDLVRVPSNCCHAFHRDCLDGWVGQGHGTCPLCRSKLLPIMYQTTETSGIACEGDPWRVERMIYLFGEDYMI